MRYLCFSDIHSNIEALDAVLADSADKDIDARFCLGDFVGYGASPNECVRRVMNLKDTSSVLGNHDAAVIDPVHMDFFNPVARAGIVYSTEHTDAESEQYLKALPLVINSNPRFVAVHSSPSMPGAWVYVLESIEAADAFDVMTQPLAFIGHTHFPAVHSVDGSARPFVPGDQVPVVADQKIIVNVGSVGQPRDGDSRAAYVIYDDEAAIIEIFRVDYDIETAAQKIIDAGLPSMLADRIRRGF